MSDADRIEEARTRLGNIRAHLPIQLAVADLQVREKLPFLALCIRDALLWRAEEMGRNGCDIIERKEFAAGILLVRGVTECAAMMWRLRTILEERQKIGFEELHKTVRSMWLGWKSDAEMPQALNILTQIDHLDRQVPGVRRLYDQASEYAHPNWSGVAGLFARTDYDAHITYFGSDLRNRAAPAGLAINLLIGSLSIVEGGYNAIGDLMPDFLAELTPF